MTSLKHVVKRRVALKRPTPQNKKDQGILIERRDESLKRLRETKERENKLSE